MNNSTVLELKFLQDDSSQHEVPPVRFDLVLLKTGCYALSECIDHQRLYEFLTEWLQKFNMSQYNNTAYKKYLTYNKKEPSGESFNGVNNFQDYPDEKFSIFGQEEIGNNNISQEGVKDCDINIEYQFLPRIQAINMEKDLDKPYSIDEKKIHKPQEKPNTIKKLEKIEYPKADYLFLGSTKGHIYKYSINEKEIKNCLNQFSINTVSSMAKSLDKKSLFVCDISANFREILNQVLQRVNFNNTSIERFENLIIIYEKIDILYIFLATFFILTFSKKLYELFNEPTLK